LKLTESIGRFYDWLQIAERGIPASPEAVPAALRRFLIARYQARSSPMARILRAYFGGPQRRRLSTWTGGI
jgi:hypothetical protein